jgi:hypothetical protein
MVCPMAGQQALRTFTVMLFTPEELLWVPIV